MSKQKTDGKVIHLNNAEFETQVLKSDVPVLVDFYADWCGPCHVIAPTIEALSNEFEGKVKFVKVDVDANQEVASRYEIMSIPSVRLQATHRTRPKSWKLTTDKPHIGA